MPGAKVAERVQVEHSLEMKLSIGSHAVLLVCASVGGLTAAAVRSSSSESLTNATIRGLKKSLGQGIT